MKHIPFLITIFFATRALSLFAQSSNMSIQKNNLRIEINNKLQTRINTTRTGAGKLMNDFSSSEYLVTKYFSAKEFIITKKEKKVIHDNAGSVSNGNFTEQTIYIVSKKFFPSSYTTLLPMLHILLYDTSIIIIKICL